MLDDLLLGPDLPGAACAGRGELFDPAEPGEDQDRVDYRRAVALRVCCLCPALTPCRQTARKFAQSEGAGGFVVAGLVIPSTRRSTAMTPTPADHIDAAGRAVALVTLAERGDTEGYARLLSDVADPEAAGAIIYGLTALVRATLSMPAVQDLDDRRQLLSGLAVDVAQGPPDEAQPTS